MNIAVELAERGWLPDRVVRAGIRALLRSRRNAQQKEFSGKSEDAIERHLEAMRASPIAVSAEAANDQHYQVPPEFFRLVLGPHLKYSCSSWNENAASLAEAEEATLVTTALRAEVSPGMRILDLGCGWGSFSLWIAARYPDIDVQAVSNAEGQRRYIESERDRRGLTNLTVVTADINTFVPDGQFDRVVSVEMFEHMRNYERLMTRIASWLRPGGALFVHLFCHRKFCYFFEVEGAGDWMAKHFFTGGMMPAEELVPRTCSPLLLERQWRINGRDYERTARAWLANLDSRRRLVEQCLSEAGSIDTCREVERWRLFFLACAELFGYDRGNEWFVGHYRLRAPGG